MVKRRAGRAAGRILLAQLIMTAAPQPAFIAELSRAINRLDAGNSGLVVGVSGGADSMSLMCGLLALGWGDVERPLVVAHLNHSLRGADSDDDEAFVQAEVARLAAGRPSTCFVSETIHVAGIAADRRQNVEAVARQLRYPWLAKVAADLGVATVATAHTADDQAETVLLNLLRGAGLAGLRGIAPWRRLRPGVRLIRPLLAVGRSDVTAYLQELSQPYREDATNCDMARTRSRLRYQLLPLLSRDFNPAVARQLGRLAGHARAVHQLVARTGRDLLRAADQPRAGGIVVLAAEPLRQADSFFAAEAFRQLWRREGWPRRHMNEAAWLRLASLTGGRPRALDLPDGVSARLVGRVVQLQRGR